MSDWKKTIEEMKFDDGKSWKEVGEYMSGQFPELTMEQAKQKARDWLRRSDRYIGRKLQPNKPIAENTFTYTGNKEFYYKFDHFINLYGFGDLHKGAETCREKEALEYLEMVWNDPIGYLIIPGDLIENAVQGGKSSIYSQTQSPQKQKETVMNWLKRFADADRILFACSANHEERTIRLTGSDIMYDIMNGLGILDRYNFTEGYITIDVPGKRHKIYCTHNLGKAESKLTNKARCFTDVDLMIGGHTHGPKVARVAQKLPEGKQREIIVVIIPAWLFDEHYGISAAYDPVAHTPQVIHIGKKMVVEW